jgi:predicted transcriptional regulator
MPTELVAILVAILWQFCQIACKKWQFSGKNVRILREKAAGNGGIFTQNVEKIGKTQQ